MEAIQKVVNMLTDMGVIQKSGETYQLVENPPLHIVNDNIRFDINWELVPGDNFEDKFECVVSFLMDSSDVIGVEFEPWLEPSFEEVA